MHTTTTLILVCFSSNEKSEHYIQSCEVAGRGTRMTLLGEEWGMCHVWTISLANPVVGSDREIFNAKSMCLCPERSAPVGHITIQTLHQNDQQSTNLSCFLMFICTLDVILVKMVYSVIFVESMHVDKWNRTTSFVFHLDSAPDRSLTDLCIVTKPVTWYT